MAQGMTTAQAQPASGAAPNQQWRCRRRAVGVQKMPSVPFHGARQDHPWSFARRILGRKAGSDPGYSYSPAMKQANIVWDAASLDAYLRDPQKLVPGNKMPFPGLKTDNDRADVIAFFVGSGAAAPAAARLPRLPPPRRKRRPQPSTAARHAHSR